MPKRDFRTPDFKTCLEDFEHFQTRSNYKGTFRVLKVEKPENVVWEKRKSFSALFLETFNKKKFFELPCREGLEFPEVARMLHNVSSGGPINDFSHK